MNISLGVVLVAQILFSVSDIMGRYFMKHKGFHVDSFVSVWFAMYLLIRTAATFGQLFALAHLELGRSQTLFGVTGLVFANLVGLFFFKEALNPLAYVGVVIAIFAFLLVGFSRA